MEKKVGKANSEDDEHVTFDNKINSAGLEMVTELCYVMVISLLTLQYCILFYVMLCYMVILLLTLQYCILFFHCGLASL